MATATDWRHKGAELYIGPAGWSYDDWDGIVYPRSKPKGFRAPTYLTGYFNAIELNNTFYRPPRPAYCRRWVQDVEGRPDFLFTAKLWQRFTHERDEPWLSTEVEVFRNGIAPLVEAGRLGAMLVQFPWSFRFNRNSQDYLCRLADEFRDLPLVIEVRSKGWIQERALQFIRSLDVGFCNIDQPVYRGNIPLTSFGFGPIGYLRLHGRNYDAWFDKGSGRDERYDYLYGRQELEDIRAAVGKMAEQVERMFVIANNHYRGQAVATAIQLKQRLLDQDCAAPGRVGELYDLA